MSGLAGNQRLSDVVDDVLRVFQTDRETDEILVDTGLFQLFVAELAVGVGWPDAADRYGHPPHEWR